MTLVHGAILAFLAVVAGAFGAHGMQNILSDYDMHVWQTAANYQMYHALALVALGLWERQSGRKFPLPHYAFLGGVVIFSGSLYLLAVTGVKILGAITPIGGLSLLFGWLALARAAWQTRAS